jgi:hypothetical protein
MRYNRLICNIISVIGSNPTQEETKRFNDEFCMGLSAQEYVNYQLQKVIRLSGRE